MTGWRCDVRLYRDKNGQVNVRVPQALGGEISREELASLLRDAATGLENYWNTILGPKAGPYHVDESTEM